MVSFIIDLVVVHGTNPTPTMIQFGIMLLSTIPMNMTKYLLLLVLKNGVRLWMRIIFSAFGSLGLRLFELLRWV